MLRYSQWIQSVSDAHVSLHADYPGGSHISRTAVHLLKHYHWDLLSKDLPCAGTQLLAAEKEDLAELIERCTVFAKVTPQQKMAIVAGLQRAGHIVGFLGDGNNDALALRKADVGVSVDSGESQEISSGAWCCPCLGLRSSRGNVHAGGSVRAAVAGVGV